MKYDFESIIERHGHDALAVDMPAEAREKGEGYYGVPLKDGFDVIPMWVADMNFAVAPSIPAAIKKRMEHPVYGYFAPRKEYFDAIIKWQTERNHAEGLTAECIGYENGVLAFVFPEGFWVTPQHIKNDSDKIVRTDLSQVTFELLDRVAEDVRIYIFRKNEQTSLPFLSNRFT